MRGLAAPRGSRLGRVYGLLLPPARLSMLFLPKGCLAPAGLKRSKGSIPLGRSHSRRTVGRCRDLLPAMNKPPRSVSEAVIKRTPFDNETARTIDHIDDFAEYDLPPKLLALTQKMNRARCMDDVQVVKDKHGNLALWWSESYEPRNHVGSILPTKDCQLSLTRRQAFALAVACSLPTVMGDPRSEFNQDIEALF